MTAQRAIIVGSLLFALTGCSKQGSIEDLAGGVVLPGESVTPWSLVSSAEIVAIGTVVGISAGQVRADTHQDGVSLKAIRVQINLDRVLRDSGRFRITPGNATFTTFVIEQDRLLKFGTQRRFAPTKGDRYVFFLRGSGEWLRPITEPFLRHVPLGPTTRSIPKSETEVGDQIAVEIIDSSPRGSLGDEALRLTVATAERYGSPAAVIRALSWLSEQEREDDWLPACLVLLDRFPGQSECGKRVRTRGLAVPPAIANRLNALLEKQANDSAVRAAWLKDPKYRISTCGKVDLWICERDLLEMLCLDLNPIVRRNACASWKDKFGSACPSPAPLLRRGRVQ